MDGGDLSAIHELRHGKWEDLGKFQNHVCQCVASLDNHCDEQKGVVGFFKRRNKEPDGHSEALEKTNLLHRPSRANTDEQNP